MSKSKLPILTAARFADIGATPQTVASCASAATNAVSTLFLTERAGNVIVRTSQTPTNNPMPRPLLLLALLLTACTPLPSDPYYNQAGNAAVIERTEEAVSTQAAAQPVTQSYLESEYAKSLTATALPPQQTATQQALQLADIAITQAWHNLTLTSVAQTVAYSQTAVVIAYALPLNRY